VEESDDLEDSELRAGPAASIRRWQRLRSGVENHAYLVRRRYTKSHPMFVYQMRSGYGLAAVLYRLKARVDMFELGRQELEERDRRANGRSPSPDSHS
jgi:hypothetical protein